MDQRSELTAEVDRTWARPVILLPVFGLISLVGGALPSFSLAANLLVLCVGGMLFWLGLSSTLPRRPARHPLPPQAVWWLLPLALLAVVEVATFVVRSPSYPTLSKLFDPVLEGYPARCALYFGWLAAFWGLVRR